MSLRGESSGCRLSAVGCRRSTVVRRSSFVGVSLSLPLSLSLFLSLSLLPLFGEEMDVARQALRDGLWEVARSHALRAGEGRTESRAVIVESYAREGKWEDVVSALEKWGNPAGESFVYYRALALFELGKADQSSFLLSGAKFDKEEYKRLATRLKARIALSDGKAVEALKIVESDLDVHSDEDSEMFAASLMSATGDRDGAAEIWKAVVARGTNASERAFAVASVELGDEKFLRESYERSVAADTKRLAGFALARVLLAKKGSLDEGVALTRTLVKAAPDAPGARDGLAAIADAYFAAGRYDESVAVYRETFDTWPDAAKESALNDGLGWALSKLGRHDEALEAFVRAEETASTDAERAKAIVKQGDVLAESGKADAALSKYRDVLAKYPATESAARIKDLVRLRDLEDRGRDLYREYRFAEAQRIFREVAERDPSRRARMDYLVVLCLYGQGLDDAAESGARKIAEECQEPEVKAMGTLWLAKYSYNRSSWTEARKLFFLYVKLAPDASDAPEALVWAARAAFAESDFKSAIQLVTLLDGTYPDAQARVGGFLVQGESLIELARFDEAVLVLERAALAENATPDERLRARLLKADALFAMGADNQIRYQEALEAYKGVKMGESLDASERLSVSYKIAKTLEKLKRTDEAVDRYYSDVVLAYRESRTQGIRFDDEARASFARAAFRLADELESRGRDYQALHVLELVATSDVPAAAEAAKRIERIQRKGNFL